MSAALRRGACPALSAPMQTGDGLIVRLSPVSGGLSPKALIGLCESAERHGNGTIEVTARGSMQFRGLSEASAPRFAAEVNGLGIVVRTGVPVETGPLAGMDPREIADPTPLVEAIRDAVASAGLAERLGPKVSVVVDGAGAVSMDAVAADVRLTATREGSALLWRLAIGGNATDARFLTSVEPEKAAAAATDILARLAAIGRNARAKDLADAFGNEAGSPPSAALALQGPAANDRKALPGVLLPLASGRFALPLALPFGSITADGLAALAEEARVHGIFDIRPAPARTLLLICPSADAAPHLVATAAALGFITDADDNRSRIAACPGAPACASGHIQARAIAAVLSEALGDVFDASLTLHVSGCAKGCARQAPADITVVGDEIGAGLVVNGTAGQKSVAYSSELDLPRAIRDLLGAVRARRDDRTRHEPGEALAVAGSYERERR